jgi:Flp pilus assembly protein TadG
MSVHIGPRRHQRRRAATGRRRRLAADRGAATVEMAVLVLPLAAVMALFAIFCFRLAGTRLDMNATAAAAARAASMTPTPQAAADAATQAAQANLADHARTCNPLTVTVDTSAFHRGGQVAVTVTCQMSTAGLTGLGLPGTLTGRSTAHAVIDSHVEIGAAP